MSEKKIHGDSARKARWLFALSIAVFFAACSLLVVYCNYGPGPYLATVGVTVFLVAIAVIMYLDPQLWYRRMTETCLATLVAGVCIGGVSITASFPMLSSNTNSYSFSLQIPEPSVVVQVILGGLVLYFARKYERGHNS